MKINITILEDSATDAETLKNHIKEYEHLHNCDITIDEYRSGEDFFMQNPDLQAIDTSAFFLDIQMGKITGLDVAKKLRLEGYKGIIIFLTAFKEYVFHGYNVRALNYLIKPVAVKSVFLCLDEIEKKQRSNAYIYSSKKEIVQIPYSEIISFSSRLHYVDILTTSGKCYEQISSLANVLKNLPNEFVQTHRSYIVNMAHIYKITGGNIVLSNHMTTQISRSYYKDVIQAFTKYTSRFDIVQ